MNVLATIVPSKTEVASQATRQDRDNGSKRGGSGFSDTMSSLDKGGSSKQGSSTSASAGSCADQKAAPAAQSGTTAPTDQTQTVVSKPAAPNTLFLEPAATPVTQSLSETVVTLPADGTSPVMDVKVPQTVPANLGNPFDALVENETLPVVSDLAKLVTALSKLAGSSAASETDETTDEAGDEATDVDATPVDAANGNLDLLSLLASTAMPVAQPVAQNVPQAKGTEGSALEAISGAALGEDALAGSADTTATVVRLQKQDVPSVDLHIATQEDGSKKLDVTTATGDVADVVQVVESRRFVGLAAPTNTTAITSAMAADPDWAASMAGQTSNSPMIASTGQVVHVLKIQMAPVELGHVTAALKLVGDDLSVQLTAHTLKGYSELQKDSNGILDALKAQGFSVDQVTVTLASNTERQDSSTGNRQPSDPGQQGAQQGQRGHEEKPQEQFNRQSGTRIREEAISHESTSPSEAPARSSSARPDHLYL